MAVPTSCSRHFGMRCAVSCCALDPVVRPPATHTFQDAWLSCLELTKQVSRRDAPRARLRTGLDPATHVNVVDASLEGSWSCLADRRGASAPHRKSFGLPCLDYPSEQARRRSKRTAGWRKYVRCRRSRSACGLQRWERNGFALVRRLTIHDMSERTAH